LATLAAHYACRLAGEGREQDFAVDRCGKVAGQRCLARTGIAEQAEDRRASACVLEPVGSRDEGGVLLRREDRHRRSTAAVAGIRNKKGT
jgi:hypothetical protein